MKVTINNPDNPNNPNNPNDLNNPNNTMDEGHTLLNAQRCTMYLVPPEGHEETGDCEGCRAPQGFPKTI